MYKLVFVVLILLIFYLYFCQPLHDSSWSCQNNEGFTTPTIDNYDSDVYPGEYTSYGAYDRPTTQLILDKDNNLITMLDMLPSVDDQYKMQKVPCPPIYLEKRKLADIFNDNRVCWQYL